MSINIRLYFTRFGGLIILTLALIALAAEGAAVALAKPRGVDDAKATAAIQTIEAVLNATPTPTPSATPNQSGTATAQAAEVQTAVAATLTARPTTKPTRKPSPTRTPKPSPTSTPVPATVAPPTAPPPTTPPVATNTPAQPLPTNTLVPPTAMPAAPAHPGLVSDFETFGVWQRGNETWGTLTQSSENITAGAAAAKLDYDFTPAQAENDFIVFVHKPPLPIPGQPKGLNMQVYGDGSSNFLNAWVQDSVGQIWQFTFGRLNHTGWQMISAPIDPALGWPNGVVQNNQSANLSYPLYLYALVLDGEPRQAMKGTLFFDDLLTTDNPARPNLGGGAAPPAAAEPAAPSAPPAETIPDESCGADPSSITAGQTALLYWKFTGVKEVYFEGQGVLGIDSKLVKPTQTATYTVRVIRNDGSEAACQITVQVN